MSYMRDRDAQTRGVGAIAATDGSAARRRQRAQMARASGARDRAMSVIARGAMGAIEYAQHIRGGATYALGATVVPPPPGIMTNLAKFNPLVARSVPASLPVTMVPLPAPGATGVAIASLPVTMTPPTPAPSAPDASTTMTMYPGGASSPVTGTPSDTGVLMGQSQSSSTMAFPPPLPDDLADQGPVPPIQGPASTSSSSASATSSNTMRNVLIVGGVAAAAYFFMRRKKSP